MGTPTTEADVKGRMLMEQRLINLVQAFDVNKVGNRIYFGNIKTINNQLNFVTDKVAPSTNGDINNQAAGNYTYDAIGNLTKDNAENITNIDWTVYGKIKSITKSTGTTIRYTYDASGNRISKIVTTATTGDSTYYVRDASGNVMSVYNKNGVLPLTQKEINLYGSSRLGVYNVAVDVQNCAATTNPITIFTRGCKFFELSNHLQNVLVTISDKKIGVDANSDGVIDYYNADVVTAYDYYPFGMIMPGRKCSSSTSKYRYGFNGKENDNDVKGEGNQQDYGMRIYDPRLGRFLSVDPITKEYPELTPYQFASNSPITFIDLDGEESAFRMPDGTTYVQPPSDHMIVPIPQYVRDNGIFIGPGKAGPGIMSPETSLALDLFPVVGTIKGGTEGVVGYNAEGDKLSTGQRFLGVVPYVGKAKNLIKVVKAIDKAEDVYKATKAVNKLEAIKAGIEFENKHFEEIEKAGEEIVRRVSYKAINPKTGKNVRAVVDGVTKVSKEHIETKLRSTTKLSKNQKIVYKALEEGKATPVGKKAVDAGLDINKVAPPTKVTGANKYE